MNGVLRHTTVVEMLALGDFPGAERDLMARWGAVSDPLFIGLYGEELLSFVGFVAQTLLSDEAYLWMWTSPAAAKHKVMIGRHAKRLIAVAQHRYPILVGHCINSERWLRSLGAKIVGNEFVIGR